MDLNEPDVDQQRSHLSLSHAKVSSDDSSTPSVLNNTVRQEAGEISKRKKEKKLIPPRTEA